MSQFKVIVEKHLDGFVAYPLGLKGVVVGEGDTYDKAMYSNEASSDIRRSVSPCGNYRIDLSCSSPRAPTSMRG